jgi:hypothetical protein
MTSSYFVDIIPLSPRDFCVEMVPMLNRCTRSLLVSRRTFVDCRSDTNSSRINNGDESLSFLLFTITMITTSMMIRSATRRARVLVDRVGKTSLPSPNQLVPCATKLHFSTIGSGDGIGSSEEHFNVHPVPLPALAYADYDDDDDDGDDDETCSESTSHSYLFIPDDKSETPSVVKSHDVTCSTLVAGGGNSGHGPTSSHPYPAPSTVESQMAGPIRKVGGGGGGGGRHRCPKCGTTVTFRCDYEENTFYCASCSGWFVANPNLIVGNEGQNSEGDGSPYDEFMAKNGSKNVDAPDILMRHVSLDTFFLHYSFFS